MGLFDLRDVVFIDTEFSSLDPYKGEVLSLAVAKLDGSELYLELEHSGEVSPWVETNILPMLKGPKVPRQQALKLVKKFLGTTNSYAVAYVDNYDLVYLTKLFGEGKLPFRWLTLDMASIMFALGHNPTEFALDDPQAPKFYEHLGIDTTRFTQHHALDDVRLLREVWLKLAEKHSQK